MFRLFVFICLVDAHPSFPFASLSHCQVTKVNPRQAHVRIVCVGETPLTHDFPGIIRSLEVRQTLVDEVEIYNCFRPGDIVQAEVVRCTECD
jgi:exosome complex RNA-binding protein Csl4